MYVYSANDGFQSIPSMYKTFSAICFYCITDIFLIVYETKAVSAPGGISSDFTTYDGSERKDRGLSSPTGSAATTIKKVTPW